MVTALKTITNFEKILTRRSLLGAALRFSSSWTGLIANIRPQLIVKYCPHLRFLSEDPLPSDKGAARCAFAHIYQIYSLCPAFGAKKVCPLWLQRLKTVARLSLNRKWRQCLDHTCRCNRNMDLLLPVSVAAVSFDILKTVIILYHNIIFKISISSNYCQIAKPLQNNGACNFVNPYKLKTNGKISFALAHRGASGEALIWTFLSHWHPIASTPAGCPSPCQSRCGNNFGSSSNMMQRCALWWCEFHVWRSTRIFLFDEESCVLEREICMFINT